MLVSELLIPRINRMRSNTCESSDKLLAHKSANRSHRLLVPCGQAAHTLARHKEAKQKTLLLMQ